MNGSSIFKFGETAGLKDFSDKISIRGKIKSLDCYVITCNVKSSFKLKTILNRFGYANRHLELEWGKFSGLKNEFIVPHYEIIKFK